MSRWNPVPRPVCQQCGVEFTPKSNRSLSKARFCTRTCYGKWRSANPAARAHMAVIAGNMKGRKRSNPRLGPANPAWKGGVTTRRRHGNYVQVRYVHCPPFLAVMARKDGYVMEHRLVMALWIGRPLLRSEVVHHLNHDPLDNRRSNLELWPDNRSHKLAEAGRCVPAAAIPLSLTA